MQIDQSKLRELLNKYVDGFLTEAEAQEMFKLIQTVPGFVTNQILEAILMETQPQYDIARHNKILSRIWNHESFAETPAPVPVKQIEQHWKPRFLRWLVAASVLIVCSAAIYWFSQKTPSTPSVTITQHTPSDIDIEAPQSSKAIIVLPDGRKISLDSVSNLQQDNIRVHKTTDGQIVYDRNNAAASEVTYHTLYNPKGSKVVDLILSDGTRVWLNCESSLRYPASFTGEERKVEITGEAYFEVAKNVTRPFKVLLPPASAGTQPYEVRVLGTHFNVNTYPDEHDAKITLLEGRIEVGKSSENFTLLPGQQASIITTGKISIKDDINLESVMAWKNGFFSFNSTGLEQIMRQISRWYNIDVIYEGTITPRKFKGEIATSSNVSDICKMLEESDVHCRIENNKIIISP